MDYLKWELERQRSALGALLGGGEIRDGGAAPDGEGRSPVMPGGEGTGAAGRTGRYAGGGIDAAALREETPGAWEGISAPRGDLPAGTAGGPALPEMAEFGAPSGRRAPQIWETPPGGGARRGTAEEALPPAAGQGGPVEETPAGPGDRASGRGGGSALAAADGESGLGGTSSPDGRGCLLERFHQGAPWMPGGPSPALREEDGARALSQAVRRDARRYDGGFSIY